MSNCPDWACGPGPFTRTPFGTGKLATAVGPSLGTGSAVVVVVVEMSPGVVVAVASAAVGDGPAGLVDEDPGRFLSSPPQPARQAAASTAEASAAKDLRTRLFSTRSPLDWCAGPRRRYPTTAVRTPLLPGDEAGHGS